MRGLLLSLVLCLTFLPQANTAYACSPSDTGVHVLTQRTANDRTGTQLNETRLTAANVNASTFGKLFTRQVDGQIYAQPLYVSDLEVSGKKRNVVFVATMHNTIYAFDADDPDASAPLWQRNLGRSIALPDDNIGPPHYADILVEVGILSTPVIDLASATIYVVAASRADDDGYRHRLHAIDIVTGVDRLPPVLIEASVPGSGDGAVDGQVAFISNRQLQRSALLLNGDQLFIAFAGYGDMPPYHGWLLSYDRSSLALRGVLNVTPNDAGGGIWQAGWGPSADDEGFIYLVTGNGDFDPARSAFGDSVLKIDPSTLSVVDWFTPYNYEKLEAEDLDLGSTGIMLVPDTGLGINGGKEGKLYVTRRHSLGKMVDGDRQLPSTVQASPGHVHGGTVFWRNQETSFVYVWSENDVLKAFALNGDSLSALPVAQSHIRPPRGMPGGILTLSANRDNPETGIVWATHPLIGDANHMTRPGILRAFAANDVSREIWNSELNSERDSLGAFAKFNPPTVASGKVYVATFSGQLEVYGLLKERC